MQEAFLSRTIDSVTGGGSVIVQIYQPEPDATQDDTWVARVLVTSDTGEVLWDKNCFGVDSMQAVQNSFSFIRSKVAENYAWLGMPAVLGFPASLPSSFGIEFYRAIEVYIESEIARRASDRRLLR